MDEQEAEAYLLDAAGPAPPRAEPAPQIEAAQLSDGCATVETARSQQGGRAAVWLEEGEEGEEGKEAEVEANIDNRPGLLQERPLEDDSRGGDDRGGRGYGKGGGRHDDHRRGTGTDTDWYAKGRGGDGYSKGKVRYDDRGSEAGTDGDYGHGKGKVHDDGHGKGRYDDRRFDNRWDSRLRSPSRSRSAARGDGKGKTYGGGKGKKGKGRYDDWRLDDRRHGRGRSPPRGYGKGGGERGRAREVSPPRDRDYRKRADKRLRDEREASEDGEGRSRRGRFASERGRDRNSGSDNDDFGRDRSLVPRCRLRACRLGTSAAVTSRPQPHA
jgi:hypothetical protein